MKSVLFKLISMLFVLSLAVVGARVLKRLEPVVVTKDLKITHEVQRITAPALSSYGADLLIDGGSRDVHAWHSPAGVEYPISIDVRFKRAVLLNQIGFQAQYGPPGNFPRAPEMVRIYGGADAKHLKPLAEFALQFRRVGAWTVKELPQSKLKYPSYRIEILTNHGDPGFVTIQELNFYGQT